MNYLFDLDGTLTDSGLGVTRCIQHALKEITGISPDTNELTRFVGPPLHGTFEELLATKDRELVARAVSIYRERFVDVGMFENAPYPDIVAGLERLTANGNALWVVTSKPHVYARQIIEHFELQSWLRGIYGSELDGENADKQSLIRIALDAEELRGPDTWMVGDRAVDIAGGRKNGTRTIGVLWGYGSEDEIRGAKPDLVIASMDCLPHR